MAKSHETTLYIVEKFDAARVRIGATLVFRTRAKARAYAKSKGLKSKFTYKVRVAKWGPSA